MGSYSRTYNFTDGTTAYGSQVAFELDALGSSVNNIVNAQISSGAAIADTKLAQITTAGKVSQSAITGDIAISSLSNVAPIRGGYRNLKVVQASAATVTVTADELNLQDASNDSIRITAVNETADITASGASGLDTGAEANSTWYFIWIIRKSSDGTVNALLSVESAAGSLTLPTGYDQYALVSAVFNDGSGDFIDFTQEGNYYTYDTALTIASGNAGTGSWASITTSNYVPSALSTVAFGQIIAYTSSGARITNDSAQTAGSVGTDSFAYMADSASAVANYWLLQILTANTLYWTSNAAEAKVRISGFIINKLVG